MTLLTEFPPAILETLLTGLIDLFLAGANGDATAARNAASHMLAGYHPRTEDELRLAASIVGFSFQALKALGQAAAPDIPVSRALRLNGSAVSLSREAAKAERCLAQLRKLPQQAIPGPVPPAPAAEMVPPEPAAEILPRVVASPSVVQSAGKILAIARANGITWTQAYKMHQRDLRIAAKRADGRLPDNRDPDRSGSAIPMPEQQPMPQAV